MSNNREDTRTVSPTAERIKALEWHKLLEELSDLPLLVPGSQTLVFQAVRKLQEQARALIGTLASAEPKSDGVEIIHAERQRQVQQEGRTPEHDDEHSRGEMAIAAACYALEGTDAWVSYPDDDPAGSGWPWGQRWWKPKDKLRNLARAGALIAAEIDRFLRDSSTPASAAPIEENK